MPDTLIKEVLDRRMICTKCYTKFLIRDCHWEIRNHGQDITLQCPDCLCSDLMPVINSTNYPAPTKG